jgi:pimeloyl-ACP methyl ester carboxylesterase
MIERMVDVGGVEIAVQDSGGDGPAMVLLHGGGRTAADWGPVLPFLAGAARVVAVDFRGHGQSERVASFTYNDGVDDVAGVVKGLELEKPVVAGHSLGGMIASVYAAQGGECRAVVNVDGHGAGHPSQFEGIPEDEVNEALDRFAVLSEEGFRGVEDRGDTAWVEAQVDAFRTAVARAGFDPAAAEPIARRGFRSTGDNVWERSPRADINVTMYHSLRGLDMMAHYLAITVPAVIIRSTNEGTEDDPEMERLLAAYRIGLKRQLDEVAAANSNIELIPFATGHMVMFDAPADLGALLTKVAAS